jgi:hypothetical protein
MIYTQKALAKMPHSPEARRFAPQVRAMFHFWLRLLAISFTFKFISKAFFSALVGFVSFVY